MKIVVKTTLCEQSMYILKRHNRVYIKVITKVTNLLVAAIAGSHWNSGAGSGPHYGTALFISLSLSARFFFALWPT